jgi:hypothetical protein
MQVVNGSVCVPKTTILLHDNVRHHTVKTVRTTLQHLRWELLDEPVYSPDLSPWDFRSFGLLDHAFKERQLRSEPQEKQAVRDFSSRSLRTPREEPSFCWLSGTQVATQNELNRYVVVLGQVSIEPLLYVLLYSSVFNFFNTIQLQLSGQTSWNHGPVYSPITLVSTPTKMSN